MMGLHDVWFTGTATAALTAALVAGTPAATAHAAQQCTPPPLPGKVVDVKLTDTTAGPMRVTVTPAEVPAGAVSFRTSNTGTVAHELVVLPLAKGQVIGKRQVGSDARVSETGSLGEASRNCGEGKGAGIAPGSTGWVTLKLHPGRYELVCNFPGHYASGMHTAFDVTK
ncbi:sulfocyanin-like copper-binding protein [Nonomuraea sp. CA-141351]|uniref:sulfocyanin-like copper-binding protein n=1 Tax=Nonomuraea sp. CA-141351 TaxID=3239996 RepID=UPI003D90A24E